MKSILLHIYSNLKAAFKDHHNQSPKHTHVYTHTHTQWFFSPISPDRRRHTAATLVLIRCVCMYWFYVLAWTVPCIPIQCLCLCFHVCARVDSSCTANHVKTAGVGLRHKENSWGRRKDRDEENEKMERGRTRTTTNSKKQTKWEGRERKDIKEDTKKQRKTDGAGGIKRGRSTLMDYSAFSLLLEAFGNPCTLCLLV